MSKTSTKLCACGCFHTLVKPLKDTHTPSRPDCKCDQFIDVNRHTKYQIQAQQHAAKMETKEEQEKIKKELWSLAQARKFVEPIDVYLKRFSGNKRQKRRNKKP